MVQNISFPCHRHTLMVECWMHEPDERPVFAELVKRLDHVIESNMDQMVCVVVRVAVLVMLLIRGVTTGVTTVVIQ